MNSQLTDSGAVRTVITGLRQVSAEAVIAARTGASDRTTTARRQPRATTASAPVTATVNTAGAATVATQCASRVGQNGPDTTDHAGNRTTRTKAGRPKTAATSPANRCRSRPQQTSWI